MEAAPLVPLTILLLGGAGICLASGTSRARTTRTAVLSWMILLGAFLACIRLWGLRLSTFGLLGSDLLSQSLSLLVLFGAAGTLPLIRTTFLRGEIKACAESVRLGPRRFGRYASHGIESEFGDHFSGARSGLDRFCFLFRGAAE